MEHVMVVAPDLPTLNMEPALLFEHLVCDNISNTYHNVGAAMFNACLSSTSTYENGINIGKVFMLLKLSLEKLVDCNCFSEERKAFIEKNLSEIEYKPTIDRIVDFLQELNSQKVIF